MHKYIELNDSLQFGPDCESNNIIVKHGDNKWSLLLSLVKLSHQNI